MKAFFQRFPGTGYICAHRGARSIAPENTHMALDKARQCGADMWETDVQASADGELVLFHDHELARTTNVAEHEAFSSRKPWPLSGFSATELSTLDAGSWFLANDPFCTLASGEVPEAEFPLIRSQKVPLLREALDYCRNNDFPLNLEIKDQTGTPADRTIVDAVLGLIAVTGTADLLLISSFNHAYLRRLRRQNRDIALAALVEGQHPDDLPRYLANLGVDAYHPDQRITDAELIGKVTAAGFPVNLWTVNELSQAQAFTRAGATAICTDWPQRMVGRCHSS